MPRFCFHQQTQTGLIRDDEGSELPDLEAAHEEAFAFARQLWAEAILANRDLPGESFEISDADGRHLLSVLYRDALPASLR